MFRNTLINTIKPLARSHSTTTTTTSTLKRTFPSLETISTVDLGQTTTTKFGHGTYHLTRSGRGNLPIYIDYKACNVPYTEVRKVQGDIVQLRNDLQKVLKDVKKEDFKIRMESMKLLIKGNHKLRLIKALEKVF